MGGLMGGIMGDWLVKILCQQIPALGITGGEKVAAVIREEIKNLIGDKRLPNGTYSYDEIKGYNDCRGGILNRLGIKEE